MRELDFYINFENEPLLSYSLAKQVIINSLESY